MAYPKRRVTRRRSVGDIVRGTTAASAELETNAVDATRSDRACHRRLEGWKRAGQIAGVVGMELPESAAFDARKGASGVVEGPLLAHLSIDYQVGERGMIGSSTSTEHEQPRW